MRTSRKTRKATNWMISALLFGLASAGCGPDTIAPGDRGDFCEKASDCTEGLFCLDNICMQRCAGPSDCPDGLDCQGGACVEASDPGEEEITGSILVRVTGLAQDVRVTISGPRDYDRMTSGGSVSVDEVPEGSYSVGCEEVAHHTVSVESLDDTIDFPGESITFTCAYTERAVTGTILVRVGGIDRDVDVTIQGDDTWELRSAAGEAVLEDAPAGSYAVDCESVGGFALAIDPPGAVLDTHGATLEFTCTYSFDAHWLAVGMQGTLLASADAITWSRVDSSPDGDWSGIAHGNGVYLLVGGLDVATSPDGLVWTTRGAPAGATGLRDVVFGNGTFVAVDASGLLWSTTDGIFWTLGSLPQPLCSLFDITYGNGRFMAVGAHGGFACTLVSVDGDTWTDTSPQGTARLNGAAYADGPMGYFLSVGMYGAGVWSFDGGDAWSWNDVSQGNQIRTGIAYGDGLFVMVGHGGILTLGEKGNPGAWTVLQDPTVGGADLTAVAYGNGMFVAVGYGSAIFRAGPEGDSWERSHGSPSEPLLEDILYTP